jgi:hypothetical protein
VADQYRVSGSLTWQSNSGNALFALFNKNGSGKTLRIRSVEITPASSSTATTVSGAPATFLTLARATAAGGESVPVTRADTNAAALPSSVRVLRNATVAGANPIGRVAILKQLLASSPAWGARQAPRRFSVAWSKARKDSSLEQIVVRAGESVVLYAQTLNNSVPLRVSVTVRRSGSPSRDYRTTYFASAKAADDAIFALVNDAGSGEVVSLRDIAVEEVGTFDSPYLQLVPVGGLIESNASQELTVVKLDTASADPLTYIDARSDVPMLPFGLPENALADSSAGSPKGFNYLKTKDFLGPVYRTMFPELLAHRPGALSDSLGAARHVQADMLCRGAGIVAREGEGIALCSAAETAAGATTAVGVAGWSSFEIGVTFELVPSQIPTINITGMAVGSRWRIERVSDNSTVAGGVTVDGTGSYVYETQDTPLNLRLKVRKATAAPYYKPFEVVFNLTNAGISIPVSQVSDD